MARVRPERVLRAAAIPRKRQEFGLVEGRRAGSSWPMHLCSWRSPESQMPSRGAMLCRATWQNDAPGLSGGNGYGGEWPG